MPTAPLIDPITLCGEMFGLGVIRHRVIPPKFTEYIGAQLIQACEVAA